MVIRTGFGVELGSSSGKRRKQESSPVRILVLAELSSQAADSKGFSTHEVDVGRIDELIRRLAPSFTDPNATVSGEPPRHAISALDDFHPDHLRRSVRSLIELDELSQALGSPATRDQALDRIGELTGIEPAEPASPSSSTSSASEPATESQDAMLNRLLGQSASDAQSDRTKQTVDALIRQALGPASAPAAPPQARDGERLVGQLRNDRLRNILMDPEFRTLERAWRSLHWLVSQLEDEVGTVHLLDIGKEALGQHLIDYSDRLDESPLHRLLVDDEDGWDLLIGDYSFGLDPRDIMLLAGIGAIASRIEAPFLGHGDLTLAGCPSDDLVESPWDWSAQGGELGDLWREFRAHPAAGWIGLATPRFVLRYPYGEKNDPVDRGAFEELPANPGHDRFLWANPAFACALLIGEAANGRSFDWPGRTGGTVPDLPTPFYDDGSGEAMQAPLEFLLDERARSEAAAQGLIVFTSGRNTNRIATPAIPSVAGAS